MSDFPQNHTPKYEASAALTLLLRLCAVLAALAAAGLAWLGLAHLFPAVPQPGGAARVAVIILVSGGIGFTTNWLAIKMLFRPRRPKPWLVVWPQGLLPREQARLAEALGRVAAQRFLNPDAIISGLEDQSLREPLGRALRREVELILAAPETRRILTDFVTEGLRQRGPEGIRALRPRLREAIERAIDERVTADRILEWLRSALHRFAHTREMRRRLARWIFNQTSKDGVMTRIMAVLQEQFMRYRERHPVRGFLAEQFVIDWDQLRDGLIASLKSEEATEDLADLLIEAAESLTARLNEPDMQDIIGNIRGNIVERVLDWVETEGVEMIADQVSELAGSEETWETVDSALQDLAERVPEALIDPVSGQLREPVRERLRELQLRVVESFPVADIVERQVLAMDPATVETMVDEIGKRELAWIQILGMILGGLAGVLLLVVL